MIGEFRVFDEANRIDTISVLDRLGIAHCQTNRGEMATCPGCSEHDALVCKNGGLKCFHDRCADAGPRANPGFRTNVDLVMCVEQTDKVSAAKQLCEWFGIALPKKAAAATGDRDSSGAPADDYEHTDADAPWETTGMGGETPPPLEEPTAEDPLRGLAALQAVAVRGRAALLARAAEPVVYVWQDIAVAGTVVTCAGPSGCGKTTCAFMIMAARATLGEPVQFLGEL